MSFNKKREFNNITSLSGMKDALVGVLDDIGFEVYLVRETDSNNANQGYEVFAENTDIDLCLNFRVSGAGISPISDIGGNHMNDAWFFNGSIGCRPADSRETAVVSAGYNRNPVTTMFNTQDFTTLDISSGVYRHESIDYPSTQRFGGVQIVSFDPSNSSIYSYLKNSVNQYCAIIRTRVNPEGDHGMSGKWHTLIIGKLKKDSQKTHFISSSQGGNVGDWDGGFWHDLSAAYPPLTSTTPHGTNLFFNHGGYEMEPDMEGWLFTFLPMRSDGTRDRNYSNAAINRLTTGFTGNLSIEHNGEDFDQVYGRYALESAYNEDTNISTFLPIIFSYINNDGVIRRIEQLRDIYATVHTNEGDDDAEFFVGADRYMILDTPNRLEGHSYALALKME